ncbi:MAG: DUF433 domain-containing protein [Gammaproteobacteria bacterium]|nr:DUF433 domain-containing protein [Gammaproteobacteria bacterium]MYD77046.1 DUF433 domain-containing protein [Gammaproteobacteria bacterium]MYJ53116.1 DUF433 domain-containing protein [Gammaproteobacteria bacterium]
MRITADLTIRETAALSGVSRTTIEKALEARVLRTLTAPARLRGGATRYLPIYAVCYFHALKAANLTDLPLRHKRAIWITMSQLESMKLETVEFTPGAMLDLKRLAEDSLRNAERYRKARDRYITSDESILGGTPVIVGTRLTVYAILGQLQDGDSIDDLVEDYPDIPRQAFEAAEIYAKTHPLRGRPSGRPWRNTV